MTRASRAAEPPGELVPSRRSLLLRRLIVLYPAAWRRRYGDEFAALLEQTPLTFRTLFDVGVSAVDAHLNPTAPMRKWPFMFERLRGSELAVFAGWILFVVSGLGFSKMTEDWDILKAASGTPPAVVAAYLAVMAGALVALMGIVFAGVPIAWAIAVSAVRTRRWRLLGLLAVPPVSLAVWAGFTLVIVNVAAPAPGPSDVARVSLFLAWVGVFGVAAIASTTAVTAAAINGEVAPEFYRRAVGPALIVAGTMAVAAIAVVAWGLATLATTPALFWGDNGLLATSTALSWLGVVAGMAIGTFAALRGAVGARAALKAS
jgi:hypothetical protein